MVYYLTFQMDHNASCAIWNENKELIVFLEEEKHSREKLAHMPNAILPSILKYIEPKADLYIDFIKIHFNVKIHKVASKKHRKQIMYLYEYFDKLGYNILNMSVSDPNNFNTHHHENHAYSAYYKSCFNEALVFTHDAGGSYFKSDDLYGNRLGNTENTAVFLFEGGQLQRTLYKKFQVPLVETKHMTLDYIEDALIKGETYVNSFDQSAEENEISIRPPIGALYTIYGLAKNIGRAGKFMGLSAYGKHTNEPNPFNEDLKSTEEVKNFANNYEKAEDLAYMVQEECTREIEDLVRKYTDMFPHIKHVCMSGGVTLNIPANRNLIKKFPHITFLFDPTCGDEGQALGLFHRLYGGPRLITNNLYLGEEFNRYEILGTLERYSIEYEYYNNEYIADCLVNDKIVAYFAKGTEIGPRALGARSLLMNPTKKENHLKMNAAKGREPWRPTACICLEEFAHEYFDIDLRYSKTMMVSFQATEKAIKEVPMVVHVDGSCRVQTLNRSQNPELYDLIYAFYEKTGVPIVSNTSFNNSGEGMANSPKHALDTFYEGDYDVLYFGDYDITIQK